MITLRLALAKRKLKENQCWFPLLFDFFFKTINLFSTATVATSTHELSIRCFGFFFFHIDFVLFLVTSGFVFVCCFTKKKNKKIRETLNRNTHLLPDDEGQQWPRPLPRGPKWPWWDTPPPPLESDLWLRQKLMCFGFFLSSECCWVLTLTRQG